MHIACCLITEGNFKVVNMPDKLLVELAKSLRNKGKEIVHLANESIEVEGIYIPAKGTKTAVMLIPDAKL